MQEAGVNVFDASMNFGHGLHGSLAAVTPFFTAAAYRLRIRMTSAIVMFASAPL